MRILPDKQSQSILPQKESQSVVNQLRERLNEIKDKIKQEGVTTTIFDELTANAKQIQTKLDEVLRRGGLLTQEDANEAFLILESQRKEELKKQYRQSTIRAGVLIVGTLLIVGGLFYYVKNRKQ